MDKFKRVIVVHSPKSTAAGRYTKEIHPALHSLEKDLCEIELVDLPYFESRAKIATVLKDGDLLIAAGGDGIINVTIDAALTSGCDVTFAAVPLGNFNDFSRTINGNLKDPLAILRSQIIDFRPLDISVNGDHLLYAAQYFTLGASAKLTEFLNSPQARSLRSKVRGNGTLFGTLCVLNYQKIFKGLGDMSTVLPPFERRGELLLDNNIGFMLGAIGTYFHPKVGGLHLSQNEFWFHYANLSGKAVRDVPYLTSWFGHNIPGEISRQETLSFDRPINLVAQVGGDKIALENARVISCIRSKKSLQTFAPNADSMTRQQQLKAKSDC